MNSATLKKPNIVSSQLESLDNKLSSENAFIDRLNACADLAGSMNALARLSGISQSGMRRYFIGGEPTRPVLIAIACAVNVNLDWLVTGKGEMHPNSGGNTSPTPQVYEESDVMGDFALVPVYNVEASAGHGTVVGEEQQISQLAFRKEWLKNKGLQKNKLAMIKAKGDSMEPTLHDGDLLLVDTAIEKIIDDAIYIIHADHHLIVKRLQQSLDGSVSVISDNPRYNQQNLNPDQAKKLKIAGRVCWYGHEI